MIDRDALLKPRLAERQVAIDGVGTVRVRALSRVESARLVDYKTDPDAAERYVLALGVVEPELSEDDVRSWQEATDGAEILTVLDAIFDLSGLKETALKEAAKRFRDGSADDAGV